MIDALGYVPDAAAQSMARQRKEVIGLVTIESRGPDTDIEQEGLLFTEEVLRGVELMLSEVGWSVLISVLRAEDRPGAFRQYLDLHRPIFQKTAAYGHFGREDHDFTWERTDKAQALRAAAGLGDAVVQA